MKNALYFILALFIAQSIQAGDKIQNGGNVIVCGNNVELLDYYEARLNGKKLQYDPNLTTYSEKLIQLFERWKNIAPKRMSLYTNWLNEFESIAGIFPGIQIPDIPDTGSVAIPSGCLMTPAAFQRRDEDIFPGEKRYMINKDLWDRMDEDQKAGLVLHELIYREAIKNLHPTSLPTRYLNSFFATEVNPNSEKYFAVVYKIPLAWAEYNGMKVEIGEPSCHNGPFENPGCNFNYRSIYKPAKEILYIQEIFDGIRTKEVSIDLSQTPCNSGIYNLDRENNQFSFEGCAALKNLYIKGAINVTDVQLLVGSKENLSIINNNFFGYYRNDFFLSVNPETSWYQTSSGARIENFKGIGRIYGQKTFQLDDNKILFFSEAQNSYIEMTSRIQFGTKELTCNFNSLKEYDYQCPSLPKQFSCKVKVYDKHFDVVDVETVTLQLVINRVRFYNSMNKKEYAVYLPKGQIVGFYKKRFGKLEPSTASRDDWFKINWNNVDGNCYLE